MTTVYLPMISGWSGVRLRIGVFNLGFEEMVRAASVAGEIALTYRLDVFCMQEVYRYPHRAEDREPDLVAYIRHSMPGWFFHEGPPETWMINMTASRYPFTGAVTQRIEERHLLMTTIEPHGMPLTLFNWHAKRDNDGSKNACHYNRRACDYIRDVATGVPFVLVGDLNATAKRLWGECNVGAYSLLRHNPESYDGSDFWAGVWGPEVESITREGNPYSLVDAHNLTVIEVLL